MNAARDSADAVGKKQKLGWLDLFRLSLFQACLGTLAVVFTGMFNRILITELAFPALLAGGGLAFEQLVSPSRVLFGHLSDSRPWIGLHRTPYILIGSLGICLLASLSVPISFAVREAINNGSTALSIAGVLAFCGLFAAYGVCTSLASTSYLALVIDRSSEKERPRCIGIIWAMLTVGIVVGAIVISIATRSMDGVETPDLLQPLLQSFMQRVSLAVLVLTLVAIWGMERRRGRAGETPIQDLVTLRDAWAVITSSRQILVFFAFLVLYTLGLFLQDPILESFAAEVFGLPISQTTLLNAYWGSGTLVGLLFAGLWFTPKVGQMATARIGCWLVVLSLSLLVITGWLQAMRFLPAVMVLFGLAAGIGTNSALTLMLDLTLPAMAGTFVGIWGLAQALSRAVGKVGGGGLLDLGRRLFPDQGPFSCFALVFGVEIAVMIGAVLVLNRLSVRQFREVTAQRLDTVLMAEVEG
jgi:BCD family chlorophyll transporter-like MFS transporter